LWRREEVAREQLTAWREQEPRVDFAGAAAASESRPASLGVVDLRAVKHAQRGVVGRRIFTGHDRQCREQLAAQLALGRELALDPLALRRGEAGLERDGVAVGGSARWRELLRQRECSVDLSQVGKDRRVVGIDRQRALERRLRQA